MSKRKRVLFTLMAIMSISSVVGAIWTIKYVIKQKSQEVYTANQIASTWDEGIATVMERKVAKIEPQLKKEQKLIRDFATAKIQYSFADKIEIIDEALISSWVIIESDEVILEEEKVKSYVEELANQYDTVGKERQFVDSHGDNVVVSGGPYGWKIDKEQETKELIDLILDGKQVNDREPIYEQKAFVKGQNDIGSTYVEVNMSEQKMWFYKEGELIVSTDIVTGNMAKGHDTPTVVGYIYNKVRNTNLVGKDYVAFVNYWMKVYGSIGIHDASWRSKFGGNIYTKNGSHGCINTPYDNVKTIFEQIEVGTPVIIFYEEER